MMNATNKLSAYLDYYKPTMSQLEFEKNQDAVVTFELKNRGKEKLLDYVDPQVLSARLERFKGGWQEDELGFLADQKRGDGTPLFSDAYLAMLANSTLPEVTIDSENGELRVMTTGDWPLVTFWETVVMSEINEMYFENFATEHGLDLEAIYEEGDRRLSEKIALLNDHPEIKFADFGTRRRFSYRWHKHVVERLANECPVNLIGTSNPWLASQYNLMPIGTYAHEMPMVYAALAESAGNNPLTGHSQMLMDWENFYGQNLSTALTDTFTSQFFFADFSPLQAEKWRALRHDSGDPFEFGEEVIGFYEKLGIDPTTKTIVYSDGLDIEMILKLSDTFKDRINLVFGWGTSLTNDLGLKSLNIVMKAVEVNGTKTVKLSDNPGKHTGPEQLVRQYEEAVAHKVGKLALV